MGKGDIKSRRGKISRGSFGVSRKRKRAQNVHRDFLENVETTGRGDADEAIKEAKKTKTSTPKTTAKKETTKKTTAKKTPAKKAPKEKTAVPKKTTTAQKEKPKK